MRMITNIIKSEHPSGRQVRSRINAGVKYRPGQIFSGIGQHHSRLRLGGEPFHALQHGRNQRAFSQNLRSDRIMRRRSIPNRWAVCAPARRWPAISPMHSKNRVSISIAPIWCPPTQGLDSLYLKIVNVRYREEEARFASESNTFSPIYAPSNISHVDCRGRGGRSRLCMNTDFAWRISSAIAKDISDEYEFQIIAPLTEASRLRPAMIALFSISGENRFGRSRFVRGR